jgi:hypothetical protein
LLAVPEAWTNLAGGGVAITGTQCAQWAGT